MEHKNETNNQRQRKSKCLICGKCSSGYELCLSCRQDEIIKRMEIESNNPIIDGDDLEVRKERLIRAKFHAHRAIELYFRGLAISAEALWGDIDQLKKAA